MAKVQQRTTYAVLGFVADREAESLASGRYGETLEIRTERGSDREVVRIPAKSVASVLRGPSTGGETGVQVFLKEKSKVETITRGLASDLHLRPISDLSILTARPPIVVIYIDPYQTQYFKDLAATK